MHPLYYLGELDEPELKVLVHALYPAYNGRQVREVISNTFIPT